MIEALSHVNWLAVGVASVAHFSLGAVWFVGLVGKHYPVVLGIADRPQEKPGLLSLAGPFACTAVTAPPVPSSCVRSAPRPTAMRSSWVLSSVSATLSQ